MKPTRLLIFTVTLSALLGGWFWFTQWTNYSLAGNWPDFLVPPLVAGFGWGCYWQAIHLSNKNWRQGLCGITFPALLGGTLWLVVAFVVLLPPFSLLTLPPHIQETRIQQTASPNGVQVASVRFRPVGAPGNGNGQVYIYVRYSWFPVIEREVWAGATFSATAEPQDYLFWKDNNTLEIPEYAQLVHPHYSDQIPIQAITFQTPPLLRFPAGIISIPLTVLLGVYLYRRSKRTSLLPQE